MREMFHRFWVNKSVVTDGLCFWQMITFWHDAVKEFKDICCFSRWAQECRNYLNQY